MTTCAKCQLDKSPAEYSPSALKRRAPWCRECRSAYNRTWYEQAKPRHKANAAKNAAANRARLQALLRSLKTGPCTDCGESFPPEVMDFDHVRGTKRDAVSKLATHSARRLQEEVDNCELVCANCHRIRTARRLLARGVRVTGFEEPDLEPPSGPRGP